jgi:glycosyltransferase involved in cell wall biosynthesis
VDLLIISHTPHYRQNGQIVGWGPTVREIDHLATLFDRVKHLAVLYDEAPPLSSLPYTARNISLIPVRPSGGDGWRNKLDVLLAYREYWQAIHREVSMLSEEDVIHVRCPANLSLLAVVYLTITRKAPRRWIKYAGNWKPNASDFMSYKWQRWLLHHNFPNSIVTINGQWPRQPIHIISFYNPCLTLSDILEGQQIAQKKTLSIPARLLFAGSFDVGKGIFEIVAIAKQLMGSTVQFEIDFVGDGPQRSPLEQMVQEAGMTEQVSFHGWVPKTELAQYYRKAHFLVFPSRSEGWPKVLSEGMAYGVVPLAGSVSSIPQILEKCGTGMALDPLSPQAFVDAILGYITDPGRWQSESAAARQASAQFTYEVYLDRVKAMFADHWNLKL